MWKPAEFGGASRDRTDGLVVANDALSQLSYSPTCHHHLRQVARLGENIRSIFEFTISAAQMTSPRIFESRDEYSARTQLLLLPAIMGR